MVILYSFIQKERHQYLIKKYADIDSEGFREKILRYRRWEDAQLSLLGRILLYHGLDCFYNFPNPQISYTCNRKPFLQDKDIHFNISHAKNLVVCIISDFPIGIDVEYLDPRISYLDFLPQMTKGELNSIQNSQNKADRFFSYWTEKEAVVKAGGKGLYIPLLSFEIINNECTIEGESFYVRRIDIHEDYKCCIAAKDQRIVHHKVHIESLNLNIL